MPNGSRTTSSSASERVSVASAMITPRTAAFFTDGVSRSRSAWSSASVTSSANTDSLRNDPSVAISNG